MTLFESLFGSTANLSGDAGDAYYTNHPLLGAYRDLTYTECRDIYRYWPLGKRIANALPTFAMSAQRVFVVKEAPPEVNEKLFEVASELEIDLMVKRCAVYARIYGLASIFAASTSKSLEALTYKEIQESDIVFNVLDPLSMGGSIQVDNNPLSPTFGKPGQLIIQGREVNPARVCVIYNDNPLYLKFNPSSFSFSGPSIYQNMILLIRSWNRCVIAMQRLATKAAAMVKTTKESANITGFNIRAVQHNLELIRSMENDGIASIRQGDTLEFFALTGVQEIDSIINQINTGLMMALSDTPSGILLDKNLSTGLSDGSEDMKAILMAVEAFRLAVLKPLYTFTDKYLCYKAFSPEFIANMKEEYPDLYRDMKEKDILETWMRNYSFEWGELYPQSENEKADTQSKVLDNLIKIKDLGSETSGLEDALNQQSFFNVDFVLKEQTENPLDLVGDNDTNFEQGESELDENQDEEEINGN